MSYDFVKEVDLDHCLDLLYEGKILPPITVEYICSALKEILIKDPNVLILKSPITVVGDIHGQFHDLKMIFDKIGGRIPDTNYLFLGDYVDRGLYSLETIMLLFVLKLRYPNRIHLLRGNHESRQITQSYGFFMEVLTKYEEYQDKIKDRLTKRLDRFLSNKSDLNSQMKELNLSEDDDSGDKHDLGRSVYQNIASVFDYLSLCALVDDEIFCVHGGLSPNIQYIDQINLIDRFKEIPHDGPMADLVWSDPDTSLGTAPSLFGNGTGSRWAETKNTNKKSTRAFMHGQSVNEGDENFEISSRGAGYIFSKKIVELFCHRNKIKKIFRAHQLCQEGVLDLFDGLLTTVWSAPNYCYRCGNKAVIVEINGVDKYFYNVFEADNNYKLETDKRTLMLNPSYFTQGEEEEINEFYEDYGEDEDETDDSDSDSKIEESDPIALTEEDIDQQRQQNPIPVLDSKTSLSKDKKNKSNEQGLKNDNTVKRRNSVSSDVSISDEDLDTLGIEIEPVVWNQSGLENFPIDVFSDQYQKTNSKQRHVEYFL
ncbi:Serine/threonine-protein phosphatase PP2A-like PPG1 [Hanseniaspora opuntiae]|uniref:Serine/threonine-protein phosphatase n=1 Tax=Hanseniaspora opuntiae TaxID=211096 RepID=A0A1E5R9I9_9ASCO|nr:Serine/threonine-protein phosphatase PP2A-like PPG1 [Hanseniaspora opuntiae]